MTPTPNEIKKAVDLLRQGEVIGLPTETVYGLAGDAFNVTAIQKIFAIKKRPFFDPLIVHIANREDVHKLAEHVPAVAHVLMKAFWPGPLTLVLPKKISVSALVTSGLETVGIRMPNHPIALQIINEFSQPLAAPSANIFGRTSPTTAQHVRSEFGNQIHVVDGGACEIGVESTVIGFEERNDGKHDIAIYRPGAITTEMIRQQLLTQKISALVKIKDSNVAPGHLTHHYMPKIPLVIVKAETDVQILKTELTDRLKLNKWQPVKLTLSTTATLAARELYAKLRECGEADASLIWVEKPEYAKGDLWATIWNRLEKAATLNMAPPNGAAST